MTNVFWETRQQKGNQMQVGTKERLSFREICILLVSISKVKKKTPEKWFSFWPRRSNTVTFGY